MDRQKTITTIFMLPTLKIDKERIRKNGFINAYSKDVACRIEYDDVIYLLFKPQDLDQFRNFLDDEYTRSTSIVEDYDHPEGNVVVVYKLDPAFKTDFDLIRKGRYSKTSPAFQKLFTGTVTVHNEFGSRQEISLQYRIFNRTKELIDFWEEKFGVKLDSDQEVWYGFTEDFETLNLDKLQEV